MQVAETEELIRKVTPAGWEAKFVVPPWAGRKLVCRGCGRDPDVAAGTVKWASTRITHHDRERRVLRWTQAMLCERCAGSRAVVNRLAVAAFLPMLPPGPVPATAGTVKLS